MTTQLHPAHWIVAERIRTDRDLALVRTVEIARAQERRDRRSRRLRFGVER